MYKIFIVIGAFLFMGAGAVESLIELEVLPSGTGIGIRNYAAQTGNDTAVSSTTFANTDLTATIAAGQTVHLTAYIPITLVGTASGIKFNVDAPASVSAYVSSVVLITDADSLGLTSTIFAEASQGVTLANAGDHIVKVNVTVTNGATAGNITIQFAQNVSDASAAIVRAGAFAEIVKM